MNSPGNDSVQYWEGMDLEIPWAVLFWFLAPNMQLLSSAYKWYDYRHLGDSGAKLNKYYPYIGSALIFGLTSPIYFMMGLTNFAVLLDICLQMASLLQIWVAQWRYNSSSSFSLEWDGVLHLFAIGVDLYAFRAIGAFDYCASEDNRRLSPACRTEELDVGF